VTDTDLVGRLGYALLASGTARGYETCAPASLFGADNSLLFTNSSIVPFKTMLLNGALNRPQQVLQPCFRCNVPTGSHSLFTMYGMVGLLRDALTICADLKLAVGLSLDNRHALEICFDPRDADLSRLWQDAPTIVTDAVRTAGACDKTRWSYGAGSRLTGRGGTIWASRRSWIPGVPKPSFPIGSFIVMALDGEDAYAEAALGPELLCAASANVGVSDLPETRASLEEHREHGLCPAEAFEQSDLVRSVTELMRSGLRPGSKGRGNILRKLIRRMHPHSVALVREALLDDNTKITLDMEYSHLLRDVAQ
jgi:alanyl-tRNA synthetase